jgi:hypothetical protein
LRDALGTRIVRVHEQSDHPDLGDQLRKQFEPLGRQFAAEVADAREVATRPGQTGDEAFPDGVAGADEDDRDRRRFSPRARRAPRPRSRSRQPCGL